MADLAPPPSGLTRTASALAPRAGFLIVGALILAILGLMAPIIQMRSVLFFAGGTLATLGGLIFLLSIIDRERQKIARRTLIAFCDHSESAVFAVNPAGQIDYQNDAAIAQFGERDGASLMSALEIYFASPAKVVGRLQRRALAHGQAHEDVEEDDGHVRISVHMIGEKRFLWQFERHVATVPGAEETVVPMMRIDGRDRIKCMNEPLKDLIGRTAHSIDGVFQNRPPMGGGLADVNTPKGSRSVAAFELSRPHGERDVYVLPNPMVGLGSEIYYFESLPVPLLQIAKGGFVQQANRLARALLQSDDISGKPLSEIVEGLGRPVSEWLGDAFAGRGLHRSEVVRASLKSRELYLQITLGQVSHEDGTVLVAVLNDATELKTLEAQFVQSQKMQAIGQLAGGVAHDFNNLLTAISGHCDLLLLRRDQADPDFADLEQINQNANRAASLVGQLLAFSRKQNLRPEYLDLRDTLADLTHLLNRLVGEKVTLSFVHDPALKMIRADKRQLEQVIMNLVVNSRDAMPEGGEIKIETCVEELREPLIRDQVEVAPGPYVVVRVSDEGVGIPVDKLPKIFEPFYTTKRTGEGTGLGLSTAYGIVKQTGGFIFADSTLGEGTSFVLYFPAHSSLQEVRPVEATPATEDTLHRGEGVVMLVEDEAPVRAFASRALRLRGYTVIEAESAEAALETLEDTSLKVDVFVTDVIMPGMDGPTWVRKALVERPDTRVVFVSGYSEESLAESQSRIPNSVFLPKPFSLIQLTATVQKQLQ